MITIVFVNSDVQLAAWNAKIKFELQFQTGKWGDIKVLGNSQTKTAISVLSQDVRFHLPESIANFSYSTDRLGFAIRYKIKRDGIKNISRYSRHSDQEYSGIFRAIDPMLFTLGEYFFSGGAIIWLHVISIVERE